MTVTPKKVVKRIIDDKDVHKVSALVYREKIYKHLIRLSPEDRYLRFGYTVGNEAIKKYVDKISPDDNTFVIVNDDLQIIAMAHMSIDENKIGEIGFSVNKECRKKNHATKLFQRALITAKVLGLTELYVVFLPENRAMRESAQKFGMEIQKVDGDMTGRKKLKQISPIELFEYAIAQQMNLFDFIVKANFSQFRLLKRVLTIEQKKGK